MKTNYFKSPARLVIVLLITSVASLLKAQQYVVVPADIVSNNLANANISGWRLNSAGNSQASLAAVADFSIPASFGNHSIRATRMGGIGNNRSFLGYYEPGKTLNSLSRFSWNRFSEIGNDSYLNIFITNGTSLATVVYQPNTVIGSWTEFTFNNAVSGNLSVRANNTTTNLSYAQLMNQYGNWTIYNHPDGIFSNFIGGIVLVSGSSSPTAAQTHTFDGVTVEFAGTDSKFFDFVNEVPQPPVIGCNASVVIDYTPGKRTDGSDLLPTRTIATNALGTPQNSDIEVGESSINFVALGFAGSITLEMEGQILNGLGNDFSVSETTYGTSAGNCARYPERIRAFASQDACHWVYVGEGCQDAEFDLGPLAWARYIKLVDHSPINAPYNNVVADGYDLDGITCLNGIAEDLTPSNLVFGSAQQALNFEQGLRKDGQMVAAARSNTANALGMPQYTNTVNFTSLGFGGSLVLRFDYAVFDQEGSEIQLVETSYGNPSCNSYPEKATVEGSLDGLSWIQLTDQDICQDGVVDVNNAGVIHYIRITDRSAASKFSGSADGYDIDGAVVVTTCGGGVDQARIYDEVNKPDEDVAISAYPNPFNTSVVIEFSTSRENESTIIELNNYLGQTISRNSQEIGMPGMNRQLIETSNLSSGVYFITVTTASSKETIRVVKN